MTTISNNAEQNLVLVGYAEIISGKVVEYPLTITDIRNKHPNVSWTDQPNLQSLLSFNIQPVYERMLNILPKKHQKVVETTPEYNLKHNRWYQEYILVDLDTSIAVIHQKALTELANARYIAETSGCDFIYKGNIYKINTSRESQAKIHQVYTLVKNGLWDTNYVWKVDNTTFLSLCPGDIEALMLAVTNHVQNMFIRESVLQKQILSATTAESALEWVF